MNSFMRSRSIRISRSLSTTTVLALAIFAGACGKASPTAKVGSAVGERAAEFNLPSSDGKTLKLSDLEGKVVVLDFWATWCPPCRKEIPGFVDLQTKYKDRDVVVVGISVDQSWDPIRPFMTSYRMNYPVVLGNQDLVKQYNVLEGIPTTFVLDRDGIIRARHVGYRPPDVFVKEVESIL